MIDWPAACAQRVKKTNVLTLDAEGFILDMQAADGYEILVPRHFAVGTHIRKWILGNHDVQRLVAIVRQVIKTGRPAWVNFTARFGNKIKPRSAICFRVDADRTMVLLKSRITK